MGRPGVIGSKNAGRQGPKLPLHTCVAPREGYIETMRTIRPHLRFAQLTDLHFTAQRIARYPTVMHVLERTVEDLNEQDLDFVLLTGDIFHLPHRIQKDLPVFRKIFDELRHPYYASFGNHDVEGEDSNGRKAYIMAELGDQGLSLGSPWYTFSPAKGTRLIVLDSTDSGPEDYETWRGKFRSPQARWLAERLLEHKDEAIIIGMHHPPVTPYPLMDLLKFGDRDRVRLQWALRNQDHVAAILCGHYHLTGSHAFGPTQVLTGPSLVEHPHRYRIFSLHAQGEGKGHLQYSVRQVPVNPIEDAPCAKGRAVQFRTAALSHVLSTSRNGGFPIALPH